MSASKECGDVVMLVISCIIIRASHLFHFSSLKGIVDI